MNDPLEKMLNEVVVLDTANPIVYIGTLVEVTERSLVLSNADMHDCRDGHANKEHYIAQAYRDEISVNRRNVVVARTAVISVSRLSDVVAD